MRALLLVFALIAVAYGQGRKECPRASPGVGICVFNPDVNCLDDNACSNGQICCPEGCGRVCKDPLSGPPPPRRLGRCPPAPPGLVGACVFNPDVNCVDDSECSGGEMCCPDGCNRVCKAPMRGIPIPDNVDEDSCPTPQPFVGTCQFDAKVNCLKTSDCSSGKICCPSGCGKTCVSPKKGPTPVKKPTWTDPSQIPIDGDRSSNSNRCPAVSSPSFGVCTFDPKVNCIDDSECKNGKICCPAACNKECVNPSPKTVHDATKP